MALRQIRECEVFPHTKTIDPNVATYQVSIVKSGKGLAGAESAPDKVIFESEIDLGKRGLDRAMRLVTKATRPPGKREDKEDASSTATATKG